MMTDEVPVSVVVFSELIPEEDHFQIIFSLDPAVSGVTASGNLLTFHPGTYQVVIHLPVGFSGHPQIQLLDPPSPTPVQIDDPPSDTSVQITVENPGTSETLPFELGADTTSPSVGGRYEPTIRCEPPPTLEFVSS